MAIDDAYATAAQYRAGIDQEDASEDVEILEYLAAISRIIEKRTGRVFNQTATVQAVSINGIPKGEKRLWVRDIAATAGLIVAVDSTGDLTYDLTLVISDDYNVGPWDAVAAGLTPEEEPIRFFELNPNSSNISGWPKHSMGVQVTATWGWPVIPVAIQKGCIAITKQLRDATKVPFTLTLESLEEQIQMSPGASKVINDLIRFYKKGIVSF